jgi:hypothetical protein
MSRIRFPDEFRNKPALVEIEYELPTGSGVDLWSPPRLRDDGLILQTFWGVQLPWNLAMVGAPRGWSDENQWFWDAYVWKRRPDRSTAALLTWVNGGAGPAIGDESLDGGDVSHQYLYSRSGPPDSLDAWIVSRAVLVAVCSGTALVIGFLLIFAPGRWAPVIWASTAILGLLGCLLAHPSIIAMALQSAVIGIVLSLTGLALQRLVGRPNQRGTETSGYDSALTSPATGSGVVVGSGSSRFPEVGSDDSTAIRVRTPSTIDYQTPPTGLEPEPEGARSSELGLR